MQLWVELGGRRGCMLEYIEHAGLQAKFPFIERPLE